MQNILEGDPVNGTHIKINDDKYKQLIPSYDQFLEYPAIVFAIVCLTEFMVNAVMHYIDVGVRT